MGVWSTEIKGNDTTLDIYSNFFEKYNNGGNQDFVSSEIKEEFSEYFTDHEDKNNSLFGLALAQWETKSLESEVFNKVKQIIESGLDLILWEELGADEKMLEQRKVELNKFLEQISTEKQKAKRRVRPKFEFTTNELIRISTVDRAKEFRINEEYTNGKYIHTSGILEWKSGGGAGILYFEGEGKNISAEWVNKNKLVIIHDSILNFTKKETNSYFRGDEVKIEYRTE
jgi:hypothetical protein